MRCRQQLQLDTGELAVKTGINSDRIVAFEGGKVEPSGDEILILSDVLMQDYNFFISNEQKSASEQVDILYRKFGGEISKDDRWIIQQFIFQCECEEFVLKGIGFSQIPFSFFPKGKYYKQHGTDAANKLREALGLSGNQVISDPYYSLRQVGIHIFRRRLMNSRISGLFINHPIAGRCVLVNYDEDTFRQNFTVAHEVAHAIFDVNESINVSFVSDSNLDLREVRANSFAANFLVPKQFLASKNITWTRDIILSTSRKLQVNPQVLLISLREINAITNDDYRALSSAKLSAHEKEDPELTNLPTKIRQSKERLLELGLSSFYVRKCHEAYSNGVISASRMAEMFLVGYSELPTILELFNLKLHHEN